MPLLLLLSFNCRHAHLSILNAKCTLKLPTYLTPCQPHDSWPALIGLKRMIAFGLNEAPAKLAQPQNLTLDWPLSPPHHLPANGYCHLGDIGVDSRTRLQQIAEHLTSEPASLHVYLIALCGLKTVQRGQQFSGGWAIRARNIVWHHQ